MDRPTTNWIAVGKPDDIPVLGARVVKTARGPIALFKTRTGEIFALLDRCPHKNGPLSEGMVHGTTVTCPLHGLNIHLDNGKAVAPDKGCVPRFPVKLEDGRIWLGLTALRQADSSAPYTHSSEGDEGERPRLAKLEK
ncbi:nitrite reductase small subunit NirD [Nitrococcus mobilis]|uniref:Nitrite assimilation small subunit n=1 Tax=Nitrococcus mobilis Nb-231 TaxID=314278 RepID=A4BLR2_9GAMM|nr:nitrite reductase small subunit NirD [Nitrococcus mobilis]EAR23250.1 Nitrite assimilation small subunit [Nitrococcus mobilis Nb-231]